MRSVRIRIPVRIMKGSSVGIRILSHELHSFLGTKQCLLWIEHKEKKQQNAYHCIEEFFHKNLFFFTIRNRADKYE